MKCKNVILELLTDSCFCNCFSFVVAKFESILHYYMAQYVAQSKARLSSELALDFNVAHWKECYS